jgi:hypothetical protein
MRRKFQRCVILPVVLVILLVLFFVAARTPVVAATTYYVGPSGNGSVCSQPSPCSLSTGVGKLTSGDTLILQNGTYLQSLVLYNINYSKGDTDSDQPASYYITIKAENDGQAILDGTQYDKNVSRRGSIYIEKSSYLNVEGIATKNCYDVDNSGNCSNVWIYPSWNSPAGTAPHHINLRRITAQVTTGAWGIRTAAGGWNPIFNIQGQNGTVWTHHILIEDCAAYGWGIHSMLIHKDTHHVTLRRFFGLWEGWEGGNSNKYAWCQNIEMYGGHDNILENAVVFTKPNKSYYQERATYYYGDSSKASLTSAFNEKVPCLGTDGNGNFYAAATHGIIVPGDNQTLVGSVVKDGYGDAYYLTETTNGKLNNDVSINSFNAETGTYGHPSVGLAADKGASNTTINNFTWISSQVNSVGAKIFSSGQSINVKNSFFQGPASSSMFANSSSSTLSHSSNRYSTSITNPYGSGTSAGSNEGGLDPNWDTAKYGYGAYLMASKTNLGSLGIGADVLYRYEDGTLTSKALWPWPMEDRIKSESGVSVTWESGGGIWKTLDGIYGLSGTPTPTPKPTPTPTPSCGAGDVSCDGKVNIVDVGIIIDNYGSSNPANPRADQNADGVVNIVDLGIVIDNYGL